MARDGLPAEYFDNSQQEYETEGKHVSRWNVLDLQIGYISTEHSPFASLSVK
jgi:hypothetical protein